MINASRSDVGHDQETYKRVFSLTMTPEEKIAYIKERAQAYVEAKQIQAVQAQIKLYEMHLERIKKDPTLLQPKVSFEKT